jgi:anti-anti-sigma regulatory factor
VLKILKAEESGPVIFSLSGRIEGSHVKELEELFAMQSGRGTITLDLDEVRLVDRGAVQFLADCELRGIKLKNCPSYIREWIETRSEIGDES